MTFPIFDANKNRIALTFNGTSFGTGEHNDIIEINGFSVRDVFSGTVEPWTDREGFEAYRIHHNSKIIRVAGVCRGTSEIDALSKFSTLAGIFNPNKLYLTSPTTAGFRTLSWVVGADTHEYQVRALSVPDLSHNIFQGHNVPFALDLLAKPWHKVNYVSSTINSGNTITNTGDDIGYPIITRALSGAGPTWVITNSSSTFGSMTIGLSSLSSGTVTLDMEARTLTHSVNGDISHLITTPNWIGLLPGANTITMTGFTSATFNRYGAYWSK